MRTTLKMSALILSLITVFSLCLPLSAAAADVTGYTAGQVRTSGGGLNVRTGAGTSYRVITTLSNGSYVMLNKNISGWWKVLLADGVTGYCMASYIKGVDTSRISYIKTSGSALNVRTGPDTAFKVKDRLPNGSDVIVIYKSGSWSRILYNGTVTGYVYSTYLAETKNTSAVTLPVVKYYQTDSRWSGVYLGSSGKTIGNIGCTVTCLAMCESYRTATTVTPDIMAKRLSFMQGGALYWPSNYLTTTNVTDIAGTCIRLLNSGKPVIVGAEKPTGGSHWVVVKGYTAAGTGTASLIINDPATASRTTLAEFLAVYSIPYKIAYYA